MKKIILLFIFIISNIKLAYSSRKKIELYTGIDTSYNYIKQDLIYEGEWFDNKPHGQGQYETEGKIYKAIWRNGQIADNPIVEIKEGRDPNEPKIENFNLTIRKEDIDYKELKFLDNPTEEMRMNLIKASCLKPKENLLDSML